MVHILRILVGLALTWQLLNPPLPVYRIDITWKNPSALQKTKDVVSQANIPHDFGAAIKCGKAIGLLSFNGFRCYGTHIT
jgi:hypothetical protein